MFRAGSRQSAKPVGLPTGEPPMVLGFPTAFAVRLRRAASIRTGRPCN